MMFFIRDCVISSVKLAPVEVRAQEKANISVIGDSLIRVRVLVQVLPGSSANVKVKTQIIYLYERCFLQ